MTGPIVELDGVVEVYGAGDTEVRALDGVTLSVGRWRCRSATCRSWC